NQLGHESLRGGMAHYGWETHLTAGDGPAHELWAQIGGERFDLRQLRHRARPEPRLPLLPFPGGTPPSRPKPPPSPGSGTPLVRGGTPPSRPKPRRSRVSGYPLLRHAALPL